MSDILTRVFGPDPNPSEVLPTLPYGGTLRCTSDEHTWSPGVRSGVAYWECVTCGVMSSESPEES